MSYDDWKLMSPEDAGFYRFGRRPRRAAQPLRCMVCGETCDGSNGLRCKKCAETREED